MTDQKNEWENELMKVEDEVIEEFKEEVKKRLERRLQNITQAKEALMPEIKRLKKNDTSAKN